MTLQEDTQTMPCSQSGKDQQTFMRNVQGTLCWQTPLLSLILSNKEPIPPLFQQNRERLKGLLAFAFVNKLQPLLEIASLTTWDFRLKVFHQMTTNLKWFVKEQSVYIKKQSHLESNHGLIVWFTETLVFNLVFVSVAQHSYQYLNLALSFCMMLVIYFYFYYIVLNFT